MDEEDTNDIFLEWFAHITTGGLPLLLLVWFGLGQQRYHLGSVVPLSCCCCGLGDEALFFELMAAQSWGYNEVFARGAVEFCDPCQSPVLAGDGLVPIYIK